MARQQPHKACPVCKQPLEDHGGGRMLGDRYDYICNTCGRFSLTGTANAIVPLKLEGNPDFRPLLSHYIRKRQGIGEDFPLFDSDTCERIFETGSLPTPHEQGDNLIRWLGDNLPGPGEFVSVTFRDHGAIMGVKSQNGFAFVLNGLKEQGLVGASAALSPSNQRTLTFAGWSRYEELKRGTPSGYKAFMAMKFNDPALDGIVRDHFRPAVAATGFNLQRLDDNPKAGLIDDRLRVEIKACRFLIADLTHANNGAYWEAGYAEGLGRPVIYTCEEAWFADKDKGTHFDTNHHLTVIWTAEKLGEAADRLKATIRATIPEAKREDA